MNKVLKVLIVDDSRTIRVLLENILNSSPDLEVVATAIDPYDAREKIKQYNPDVITLDIEMPKMDGITFLKNLMRLRPIPVVMVSTLTQHGSEVTFDALACGAVDYVPKPRVDVEANMTAYSQSLIEKVIGAAGANLAVLDAQEKPKMGLSRADSKYIDVNKKELIAIGASTGGTEALKVLLADLPQNMPPILVVQHIGPVFSTSFAKRLDQACALNVIEVSERVPLESGTVYIAPGDKHLVVEKVAGKTWAKLDDSERYKRHKPSVDKLFLSVAQYSPNSLGVLLTGMGDDGAEGLLNMKQNGSLTMTQDEKSCVVWGMPRKAVELGASCKELALTDIANALIRALS